MSHFDTILAMALAGEGGGSGSSDFSTAEVTVSGLPEGDSIYVPNAVEDEIDGNRSDFFVAKDGTITVILYKGKAIAEPPIDSSFTLTGDIDADGLSIIITGDGTITFS